MVTNGMVAKMRRERRTFDAPWLLDANGVPSTDPNVIFADPPGRSFARRIGGRA